MRQLQDRGEAPKGNDREAVGAARAERRYLNAVDELAERRYGVRERRPVAGERRLKVRDRRGVGVDRARVKIDDAVGRFNPVQLALEVLALATGAVEREKARIACRRRRPGADAVDELLDLGFDSRELAAERATPRGSVAGEPLALGVIGLERGADGGGREQLRLQPLEHSAFERDAGDCAAVCAGALLAVPRAS